MSASFSQRLRPLFTYLKAEPKINGNEEAFELVMRSDLSLQVLHYPENHITLSCMIPIVPDLETGANTLWELLQANLMNEQWPPIVLAAAANTAAVVVWSRMPIAAAEPEALLSLYERMAHYTHTLGRRLGAVSQPEPEGAKP